MNIRLQRLESVLKEEVAKILSRELSGDEALVTVTGVEISPDLLHAAIYISVYPQERAPDVLAACEERIWRLQQALNKRLRMRPVPKVRFVIDRSEEKAARITDALKRLEKPS